MPNINTSEMLVSSAIGTGSQDLMARDDALSQAMLKILERVAGPNTGSGGHGGVIRVAPNVAEYWIEAIEQIMDDLYCTLEQKLKGAFFKTTFQGKYVGAIYANARKREFLNLTQGDRSVAEYEAEFLRLSRYAQGMVASEYERCVYFEDGLRDNLRVLIPPQRE
ncbi:uncharacterized protein [Gossypium hirsutum]|uniref:Retrotransposon gag domain-containing protein n=1 Tax=Gossypium hirsutum TaxID=3635 RepID=A0A1U8PNL4_GOSHI|nr:uncharacterized protein LOC107961041 [Gossypium hirsutum]